MRRVFLRDIGVFEIIPNSGQGSCLFQALSQALTCSPKYHKKIRHSIVKHMTCHKMFHKLIDLPEFWRRRIISEWLEKENAQINKTLNESLGGQRYYFALIKRYFRWSSLISYFKDKRRRHRYNYVKKFLQTNQLSEPVYLKKFKHVFRAFMSSPQEPGTRFELEAAANKFKFHFDFLQALPMNRTESSNPLSKLSTRDIQNNNNEHRDDDDKIKTAKKGKEDELTSEKEKAVKIGMYQFHSCRNIGCELSTDETASIDHFYFLHSSIPSALEMDVVHSECQNGHWELLLPIFLCKYPVPLNRCVVGFTYEITDKDRDFISMDSGRKRETIDKVAKAIDSYIHSNPKILPQPISQWPAFDGDDYTGCCSTIPVGSHEDKDSNGNYINPPRFWNDMVNSNTSDVIKEKDLNNCNMDNIPCPDTNADLSILQQPFTQVNDNDFSMKELVKRWKTCVSLVSHTKIYPTKKTKWSPSPSYKKLDA